MKTRIFIILIVLSVVISSCNMNSLKKTSDGSLTSETDQALNEKSVDTPIPPDDSFSKRAESEKFELYLNSAKADFYIKVKDTGTIWQSNINSATDKGDYKGLARFKMNSQLFVNTYDETTGEITTVVSNSGSVNKDSMKIYPMENGFRAVYNFPMIGVTVPMDVKIDNECLSISVDPEQIIEEEDVSVVGVSIAPYFGSASLEDKGYILVPDGSGAIINFNNGKDFYERYTSYVYGQDIAYNGDLRPPVKQSIKMPIFGSKKNDDAFLAVITQGDASAEIEAEVSGQVNDQNTVFSTFVFHGMENVVIGNTMAGNTQDVIKYDLGHSLCEMCEVKYYFLNKESADYSGMAMKYKEILGLKPVQNEETTEKQPLFINFFGGLKKNESFMGLLIDRYKVMTSFQNAEEIIETLKLKGVESMVASYTNWTSDDANGKYPGKARPAAQLGGTKGINNLNETLDKMNIQLYTSFNPFDVKKDGNGFIRLFNSAKRISGQPTVVYDYKLSTLYQTGSPSYIARPGYIINSIPKYENSLDKQGIDGILFSNLGNIVYTDFRKGNFCSRSTMKDLVVDALKNIKKDKIFVSANAYVFDLAKYIIDAPITSSNYNLIDYDIPFYQLVLSGRTRYSVQCVNTGWNLELSKLKALETGSGLYFNFVYNDPVLFMETRYDNLYGTNYTTWLDDAAEAYKEINDVFSSIGSTVVVSNQLLSNGVYMTGYENGNSIIINYNETDFDFNGENVPARDFLIIGKEK